MSAAPPARLPIRHVLLGRIPPVLSALALALVALTAISHSASAAEQDARALFDAGRAAFEQQDYAAALASFEAALAADLNGPAVHFNIGVAAYRLGDYDRAERAFLEVTRTPSMAALAYYNLGLVEQRRGRSQRATNWFTRAAAEATDDRLKGLAAAQLERLPPERDRTWAGYASLGVGYDDNVALISDSEVLDLTGREDGFAEAQLAVSTSLLPWRFDAGLVATDYFDLNRFDQLGLHGGARYRFAIEDWSNDVALQLAYSTLDGEGFENRAFFTLRARRPLRMDWDLIARYRLSHIEGLNEFDGIGGQQHEGRIELARSSDLWDLTLGYELELSDHDDETLSATRHQVRARLARQLSRDWSIEAESAVLRTSYDEANDEETRTEIALAVARSLNATWRIVGRYEYADNDADVPEFNYGRNRIALVLEAIL